MFYYFIKQQCIEELFIPKLNEFNSLLCFCFSYVYKKVPDNKS